MTKKEIIKWWEMEGEKRSQEIKSDYNKRILAIRDNYLEDSGILVSAGQIVYHLNKALDELEGLKLSLSDNPNYSVKNNGWYGSLICGIRDWSTNAAQTAERIKQFEIDIHPVEAKLLTGQRDALLKDTYKQFQSVAQNLRSMPTAKACEIYLQSLDIKLPEISKETVTALTIPVDKRFLILSKPAEEEKNV